MSYTRPPRVLIHERGATSGGATPGRFRSNDLAEELPPWLVPWLSPCLTKISINFINIAHVAEAALQNVSRDSYSITEPSQLDDTCLTTLLTWK